MNALPYIRDIIADREAQRIADHSARRPGVIQRASMRAEAAEITRHLLRRVAIAHPREIPAAVAETLPMIAEDAPLPVERVQQQQQRQQQRPKGNNEATYTAHLKQVLRDEHERLKATSPYKFALSQINIYNEWKQDEKRRKYRFFLFSDVAVASLLSLGYLLAVPCRGFLNPLAPTIRTTDTALHYDLTRHGNVLISMSIASAVGKLVTGFVIDLRDPRLVMMGCIAVSAICVFIISEIHSLTDPNNDSQQFAFLVGFMVVNSFAQAGIWAAGVKFIHDHFRAAQVGRAVALLAIGGRLGTVTNIQSMQAMVDPKSGYFWTDAAKLASAFGFASVLVLASTYFFPHPALHLAAVNEEDYIVSKATYAQKAPPKERIKRGLPKFTREEMRKDWDFFLLGVRRWMGWWTKRQFVLIAFANASMSVVGGPDGFEGFGSLFTTSGLHMTSSGVVTIMVPLGVCTSLAFGAYFIESLTRSSQARAVLLMLMGVVVMETGVVILTAATEPKGGISPPSVGSAASFLFFAVGLFVGYPYFVPISAFAIHFGGEHAALCQQTLSLFASAVCVVFVALVGQLASTSWTAITGVVLLFAILALVVMGTFHYFERLAATRRAQTRVLMAVINVLRSATRRPGNADFRMRPPEAVEFSQRKALIEQGEREGDDVDDDVEPVVLTPQQEAVVMREEEILEANTSELTVTPVTTTTDTAPVPSHGLDELQVERIAHSSRPDASHHLDVRHEVAAILAVSSLLAVILTFALYFVSVNNKGLGLFVA